MKHVFFILYLLIFAFKAQELSAQNTIGLLNYSSSSNEGYTLFAPVSSTGTFLIDNCGFLVHGWSSDYKPGMMAYLLEDGSLLRTARISSNFIAGGSGGRVEKISWENELIWAYDFSSTEQHSHHDIEPLSNGNFLIILWNKHSEQELINMGRDLNYIPSSGNIWSEKILEVKPIGSDDIEIIWEWNAWDHLIQDFDSGRENFGNISENPHRFNINYPDGGSSTDWLHMNSIDYNEDLDQICINSRTFNEFYIIDHSTSSEEAKGSTGGIYGKGGDILFRWGNPLAYDQGDEEDQILYGQHDAQWIESSLPGGGNILVFNNGNGRPFPDIEASTVEEINIDPDRTGIYQLGDNGRFGPDSSIWVFPKELSSNFHSPRISGAERMPNGTTLTCLGQRGIIQEVDQNENVVWSYRNPIGTTGPLEQGESPTTADIFKVRRYQYDYPAFQGRDLSPIAPIELSPNPTDCLTTSIKNLGLKNNINIYPNPFIDLLNIYLPVDQFYRVEIFNQVGQRLSCERIQGPTFINPPIEHRGIYLIKVTGLIKKDIHTQTLIKL